MKKMTVLKESYDEMKREIEYNDPSLHIVPRFNDRVGKFFNLRENKGVEIEEYWKDLCDQYGEENLKKFERQIRDVKTLKEATSAFLRYRTQIDPDFAVAQPINQYAMRSVTDRKNLLEHQGVPVPDPESWETEMINRNFERRLIQNGLQ